MYEFDYQRVHRLQSHCHNGCEESEGYDSLWIWIHAHTLERGKQRSLVFADSLVDENPRYDHGDWIHFCILCYNGGTRTVHHEFSGDSAWYSEVSLFCYNEDIQNDQFRS